MSVGLRAAALSDLDDLIAEWWRTCETPTVYQDGEHLASTLLAQTIFDAGYRQPSPDRITAVLAEHRWTKKSRCLCGWQMRVIQFPEPYIDGLEQFEDHQAEAIAAALGASA